MSKKETKREGKSTSAAGANKDRAAIITELFRSFPGRSFAVKTLAAQSGGNDREGRSVTKEIVEKMLAEGVIIESASHRYKLSATHLPSFDGVVDMLASGDCYVIVEGMDKDVFVQRRNAALALNGDKVKVSITHRRKNGDPEGEIVEIVARSEKNYVGTIERTKNHGFVTVDSRKIPVDIFIQHVDESVNSGDKVVVHVVEWGLNSKCPTGELIDVLGRAGDNTTEMHAILAEYGLPYHFPEDVDAAADRIPEQITDADVAERRDFRNINTFTIDPADAKDFDDALSIRTVANGVWEVGVHIADVTHYVTENSIIEAEGRDRATSVYLVDRTVPMLPEKLSNGLCSLRPNEEKLCFSAVFEIDSDLNIQKQWIGRTVICSNRRFTYEEAQKVIETGEGDLKDEILTLNTLAQKMRAERFRNGAVSFEREEAKFVLDEAGKPLGVYFKEQKEANQLIEEFMLLANKKVAEFVGKKRGEGANAERTFVYRVHDKPNPEKLEKFSNFIMKFGYKFNVNQLRGKNISKELNRLMADVKGKSEENVISTLAVRSMAKAFYSTDNIGHYGLAFPFYTHFTSPIRRYPDMMVHRLLARYLAGGNSADKLTYQDLCDHSSDMEVRAAEAERASIKYKMVEFMTDKIGQDFVGVISGVTEWGIYVELEDTHIEGMVSLRDIAGDFYAFDADNYAVVGQRTHRTLTLGDRVRIKVKSADLARKLLDFSIVSTIEFKSGKEVPFIEDEPQERPHNEGRSHRGGRSRHGR